MLTIIFTATLLFVTAIYLYKYIQLKKLVFPSDCISVLKEIIELSLNKENLVDTSANIVNVLINKYKMDYCTIFVKNKRGMSILSTNIRSKNKLSDLEEYISSMENEMVENNTDAKIYTSKTTLKYPTAVNRGIKYMYYIPLKDNNQCIGSILIENMKQEGLEEIEKNIFKLIISTITIVLQDLVNKNKLSMVAYTDGLTGLLNRAALEKQLPELLQMHKNIDMPFCIVMLDIDHFKKVNDTYGHVTGDRCLKQISAFLQEEVRAETDRIFRYGGEEILIFLNRTSNKDALKRIETIRQGISKLAITSESGVVFSVTASFGISEYPTDGGNIGDLIKKADKALYLAKESGRNRAIVYDPVLEQNISKGV